MDGLTPVEQRAPGKWQIATIVDAEAESRTAKTLALEVPMWLDYCPGQGSCVAHDLDAICRVFPKVAIGTPKPPSADAGPPPPPAFAWDCAASRWNGGQVWTCSPDGTFRANLEETGMSYGMEIDMIAKAHAKDMLTTPYVFSADNAAAMAKAGADIIVCHLGLTTGGSIGASTALTLAQCPALVDEWADAALRVNPKCIILVHGGPVAMPEDADFVLKRTASCHGFYGASSMERLPTEVALTEQTRAFKRIKGK